MKKLLLLPAMAVLAFASCNFNTVKGNGHTARRTYPETGFRDIEVNSSVDVIVKQGTGYSISVEADENILELIKVRKEGDKLVVGLKNNVSINTSKGIKVYITAPAFHKLDASGASNFRSEGLLTGNDFELDLSGASNAKLYLEVQQLNIDASGASEIMLKGKANDFSVDGSGATRVKAFDFRTENASIELSGAGDAEVYASRSLRVDLSGAGNVVYRGNPPSISKEVSGAGSLNKAD